MGELTVLAYLTDGFGSPAYAESLRDAAGRAAAGNLLIAVRPEDERLLGTVSLFAAGTPYAELAEPGEMEIRMLAVDPAARRSGVGSALAAACVHRARAARSTGIRLSTQAAMAAAHRIYERLGFRRTPDLDWSPVPGGTLLTYALELDAATTYCDRCGGQLADDTHDQCRRYRELEPPRYCRHCGCRLVVQITPRGWTARCPRHGVESDDRP